MKIKTLFLKAALIGIALVVLLFSIFLFPLMPAGIAGDMPTVTYEAWLFVAVLYFTEIVFFLLVIQAFKLLILIDHNDVFSEKALNHIRWIKIGCGAIGVAYLGLMPLVYQLADIEDAPGVVLIAGCGIMVPFILSVFMAVLQKLLESAIALKNENDLTV